MSFSDSPRTPKPRELSAGTGEPGGTEPSAGGGVSLGKRLSAGRVVSADMVLAVVTVVPALALAGWLLAGLPLLLLGWFRPLLMVPLGLAATVLLCRYALRRLPEAISATVAGSAPATARQTAAVIGIAVASGVFNGFYHSEQLIIRRDPATYAQYAIWLAQHGGLPITNVVVPFGGADPALRFDSMGFFPMGASTAGGAVVPQFMAGPPMIYAVGHWLGGVTGLLLTPPILGALAVLTFSGVVTRLVGARWAALAALTLAVSLPILYTSRTTFSEIPSLILLFGGMALLLDARSRLEAAVGGARTAAGIAGLVFGLSVLVRIDGLRDVLPVLVYAGLLVAVSRGRLRRDAVSTGESTEGSTGPGKAEFGVLGMPLLAGLVVGIGYGLVAGYVLSHPYVGYLAGSLKPLMAICVAVIALTFAGAALAPRIIPRVAERARSGGVVVSRILPNVLAWATVLVMVGLAVRPWVWTERRIPVLPEDELTAKFIEQAQLANHLPIDRTRLYYEDSLFWVIWYVGVPVVVLATFAVFVLVRRLARGRDGAWLLPLAIIGWTTVTTLWRPAITPDHPWASRRLVPIVIPGLILLAVWGLRRLRSRRQSRGRNLPRSLRITREPPPAPSRSTGFWMVVAAALVVAPGAITSIGTAFSPVGRGEAAAVAGLCSAIPADASVLIVERVTGDRFTEVVRGQCAVPTARVNFPTGSDVPAEADVRRLISAVRSAGRRPILLAAEPGQLTAYGSATQVMRLRTRQDERSLVDPPNGTWSLSVDVWLATAVS